MNWLQCFSLTRPKPSVHAKISRGIRLVIAHPNPGDWVWPAAIGTTPTDLAGRKRMSEGLSIQRTEAATANG
jgi:hypothetical protein